MILKTKVYSTVAGTKKITQNCEVVDLMRRRHCDKSFCGLNICYAILEATEWKAGTTSSKVNQDSPSKTAGHPYFSVSSTLGVQRSTTQ